MPRPDSISEEDLLRWSNNIDNDPGFPKSLAASPTIREVCYAGLWLAEQLSLLDCPSEIIVRIQFTCGKLSFGRDPWEVNHMILQKYETNQLVFEEDPDIIKN